MRLSVLGFIMGLALLAAPVSAEEAHPQLTFGKSVYKQFCSHCHGLDMVNPGTSSYDLRKWPLSKRPQFETAVLKGKGDMPAWGDILTEDELSALWRYVATRGGKEPFSDEAQAGELKAPANPQTLVHEGALTACLARNGGVMSSKRGAGRGVGLDYEIAYALAERMGRKLEITWFESEQEEESTPVKETYALLAYGLCDISPGFALYEPALNRYPGTRGALPRWDDRPEHIGQSFQVDLAPIAGSDPYARMEIGLVVREDVDIGAVKKISDLDNLKVGIEQGTLPGVLTIRQGTDKMVANAMTVNPGPNFLWEMENGVFEAALVTVGAFDFHRRQNAVTKLKLTDYRHPIGFNLGIAMPASNTQLLAEVNAILGDLLRLGEVEKMAKRSGVHFAEPTEPYVQAQITMKDILSQQ